MTEFAVRVIGEEEIGPEGKPIFKGLWVLAIDAVRDRFLLATESGKLRWVKMADCVLVRAVNPDMPRPVIAHPVVSAQPLPSLVIPRLDGLDGRK